MNWLQLAGTILAGAVVLRALIGLMAKSEQDAQPSQDEIVGHVPIPRETDEFLGIAFPTQLKTITVTDGVHITVGASYVNNIFLEAPDGLIIVDTTERKETAAEVFSNIRKLSKKPVKAIIYTHFHADHVQGTEGFLEDDSGSGQLPDIWAYHTLVEMMNGNLISARKTGRGLIHQFGLALGKHRIFPYTPHGLGFTYPRLPNKLVYDEVHHATIAGLKVTFYHLPGETDDHMVVWIPDKKVLLCGDNFYYGFPNVYAIRGSTPRDPLVWAESVRRMRALGAEHILPGHGHPVSGAKQIFEQLSVFASAMQYVHDQTVRHMNELRHPDEIGQMVKLPPDLASHPNLAELYGKVEWVSKAVYQRYVGWFSGDPVELQPLVPVERSQKMIDMIGVDRLLAEAESSLKQSESQWALELSSHVVRAQPDNLRAKNIRMRALRARAAEERNPSARNFYLTAAMDTYGLLDSIKVDMTPLIQNTDVKLLIDLMKVRLKAETTNGVQSSLTLYFEDSKRTILLQLEYSVLTVDELTGSEDKVSVKDGEDSVLLVTTTERVWNAVMFGLLPPATAYSHGDLKVTPTNRLDDVRLFLSYF